jgi:hypothetical protein
MRRAAVAALAAIFVTGSAYAQDSDQENLTRRMIERRAVEAVIWAMPAVNFELMYQAMVRETKGGFNQIVYWSGLPDWKNQTLTPNPDAIYLIPFIDTKEVGPIVIEIPPADDGSITGTIMDSWQTPLADVGPAGVDAGKGGKYVILSPDYTAKVPDGYIALRSLTYRGYALLRSILNDDSDTDIVKAVDYGKRIKVYPLSTAGNPSATTFVNAINVVYDATIPYDIRFFQALDRFVQGERWITRDKVMIGQLGSIGIEKGKAFAPDKNSESILNAAASEAHALLELNYENAFSGYFADSRWALPAQPQYIEAAQTGYAQIDTYPVDARALVFTFAFFTPKTSGKGSFYLMDIRDRAGEAFDGGKTYHLTVPANVPVTQYWSATVYDRATHALIRDQKTVSRSSLNSACKRMPTVRSTSISVQRLPRGRSGIGCRPARVEHLRCCSASMVPRSHFSKKSGCSRTSSASPLTESGGVLHQADPLSCRGSPVETLIKKRRVSPAPNAVALRTFRQACCIALPGTSKQRVNSASTPLAAHHEIPDEQRR